MEELEIKMNDLEVVYENVSALVKYENNANLHSDEQVTQIANSILQFGFCDPIGVWTNKDGKSEIVAGHGRLQAAIKLGLRNVPVIHLDSLTDEQRRAYTHVHNQLTRNSEFDIDVLDMELAELNFNWDELGFSDTLENDIFDESGLDSDEAKENVIVSINIPTFDEYQAVKKEIERIAEISNATISVKMA